MTTQSSRYEKKSEKKKRDERKAFWTTPSSSVERPRRYSALPTPTHRRGRRLAVYVTRQNGRSFRSRGDRPKSVRFQPLPRAATGSTSALKKKKEKKGNKAKGGSLHPAKHLRQPVTYTTRSCDKGQGHHDLYGGQSEIGVFRSHIRTGVGHQL